MHPDHAVQPLGPHCGALIRRSGEESLDDLPSEQICRLFRQYGLLLFRDFGAGPAAFDAIARRFTATYFYGYGRTPFADYKAITCVNESLMPLPPHCDNGIRPESQRPDITWFYCESPAKEDGETTFFDGIQVWQALSEATRRLLSEQRIRYVSTYAEPAWRGMGFKSAAAFAQFVRSMAGTPREPQPDGAVEVEVLTAAVREPRFAAGPAFISSLSLAGAVGFEAMRVTLEDGSELPEAVAAEIRAALAATCQLLSWQAGDVAMLDNSRFLHGRRGFRDPGRRLYLIQTLRATF